MDNSLTMSYSIRIYATSTSSATCPDNSPATKESNWVVMDGVGTIHPLPTSDYTIWNYTSCNTSFTDTTTDGSGFTVSVQGYSASSMYDRAGNGYIGFGNEIWDAHGSDASYISASCGTGNTNCTWTQNSDTVLSSSGTTAPSYTWTDISGGTTTPTVSQSTTDLTVKTVFGCTGGPTDVSNSSTTPMTTGITFADQRSLGLTYEVTPSNSPKVTGRLASLSLPEGGTITYNLNPNSLSNDGLNCTHQTPNAMTRVTSDGTTKYTLAYSLISGVNYKVTDTVLDNGNNQTVYTFTGLTSTGNQASPVTQAVTEIQRSQGSSTLLTTDLYSYNTAYTTSPSASTISTATVSYPITKLIVYHQINGMSNWSATETHYDTYGNTTYVAKYDFGGSSPVIATTTTYYQAGTSCGALSSGSHINNKPCEVQTSQGGSVVADSKFTFNQYGDLTKTSIWNGSAWIGQTSANTFGNPSRGTPLATFDLNNNETDYTYDQTYGCYGWFPTKIENVATGLYTQATYDCNGHVKLTDVDANGNTTTYGYKNISGVADPYWRVTSVTDPLGNTAWTTLPFRFLAGHREQFLHIQFWQLHQQHRPSQRMDTGGRSILKLRSRPADLATTL